MRRISKRVPKVIDLSTESLEALFAADDQIYVAAVLRSLAPDLAREVIRLRDKTSGAMADQPRVSINLNGNAELVERLRDALEPFARIGEKLLGVNGWGPDDKITVDLSNSFNVLERLSVEQFWKASAAIAALSTPHGDAK